MKTLLKMAWRNIWRNKRRALILLSSMTAGMVGVMLSAALTEGWLRQLQETAVRCYEGHLKVLGRGFQQNPVIEHSLAPSPALDQALKRDPRVRAWAQRVMVQGLLSTARHSKVVSIVGIDPESEARVSILQQAVHQGHYLSPSRPQQILIGRRLAEKLGCGPGKKVVLMAQQQGGELGSGAFRIAGLFDTDNGSFDERMVYLLKGDLQAMLNLGDRITETVVILGDITQSRAVADDLARLAGPEPVEVLTWEERLPFIVQTIKLSNRIMVPYYTIFYLAMAFGIVNTLLMAIGERTAEFGVMMAVGMRRARLVGLILLESLFLAGLSVVLAGSFSWLLAAWLARRGINLSLLAEGMNYLGLGRILYPCLTPQHILAASLAALAVTALFSAYPAARAARLVPVEAMRRIR